MIAGEYVGGSGLPNAPIEVEIVEPPPPVKKRVEEKKEEKVEEKKVEEKKVEEKKVEKKVQKKRRRRRVTRQPVQQTEPPASGVNTNDDAPAPVISMPGLNLGDGPLVARGKRKSRYVGTGGTGTNTGGGGPKESTGKGPPRAVSIAAIKKRAKPLNPDLDTSKLYPPEAKRLGIEGKVKVLLIVDATGKVVRPRITKGLGHGLDKIALKLARKLRFKPAIDTDDKPVADKLEWTFTFVLPK